MLSKTGLMGLCLTTDPPVNRTAHSVSVITPGDAQAKASIDIATAAGSQTLQAELHITFNEETSIRTHTALHQSYQAHPDTLKMTQAFPAIRPHA